MQFSCFNNVTNGKNNENYHIFDTDIDIDGEKGKWREICMFSALV
jgi:hypothetical protein